MTAPQFSIPWTCPRCATQWVWVGEVLGFDFSSDQDERPAVPPSTVRCWACRAQTDVVFPENARLGSLRNEQEWTAYWAAFPEPPEAEPSLAWKHADAVQLARTLVMEIALYEPADVEAGRRAKDLRVRLQAAIEDQRQRYEMRVAEAVRKYSGYFDEEILRVLAQGDASLLGEGKDG